MKKFQKAVLFGSIKRIRATGGHRVNPEKIQSYELERELDAVSHVHCVGCGLHLQVETRRFHELVGEDKTPQPNTFYIEVMGCSYCDAEPKTGTLKKIPRH